MREFHWLTVLLALCLSILWAQQVIQNRFNSKELRTAHNGISLSVYSHNTRHHYN